MSVHFKDVKNRGVLGSVLSWEQ